MRVPTPKKIAPNTYKIRIGYQDPATGRRASHTLVFQGKASDADKVAEQLALLRRAGIAQGLDPETLGRMAINNVGRGAVVLSQKQLQQELADSQTFADYVEGWLSDNRVTKLAPKTRRDYAYKIRHYACPYIGVVPLSALTKEDIQDLLNALSERGLSSATRKGVLAVVAMALESASEDKGIPNVARKLSVGNHEPPRASSMDADQARSYEAALSDDNLDRALLTLLETGARPGEVLGLKREDLRLEGPQPAIVIRRSVARSRDAANEKLTKSRNVRSVLIGEHLRDALLQEVRAMEGTWPWLFHDAAGLPYWHSTLRDRHFATLKAARISEHFRLYDLRHTHATLLLQQKMPPKAVSERLGHADVGFTMQVYAHVLPTMQEEAPRLLDDLLRREDEHDQNPGDGNGEDS